MTQAIHTAIAAQPARPCEFAPPSIPARPVSIPEMSKAESETASLWFMLAALALPLALGGAAAAGYWLTKGDD